MNNFNKNRSSTRQSPKQAGYSLIFAVLISATLVTIGAAMANLALKEFAIVGTSRASQAAFYAADAGMECALYYDFQGGPHFREPYECDSNSLACAPMTQIRCDEQDIGVSVYNDIGTVNTMSRLGDRYRVYNE
ncbi:MAG: hypothetical protein HYV68_00360, partial [Candidatus Taylorbacteria bacterium]|nr:hypothetical protein [Candidatus Taylorbacteria bacterium]